MVIIMPTKNMPTTMIPTTIGELMEIWFPYIKTVLKPSTYALYQNYSHKYLLPIFECMPIKDFGHKELYDALAYIYTGNGMEKPKLASNTIYILEEIMRAVFRYGAEQGLVPDIDFGKVKYRTTGKKEVNLLSDLELQQFLRLMYQQPVEYRIQMLLPLYTGIGLSELCGLTWKDIDLPGNMIHIHCNVKRVQSRKPDGSTGTVISTYELEPSECRSFKFPPVVGKLLREAAGNQVPNPAYYVATCSAKAAEGRTLQYRLKNIAAQLNMDLLNYRSLRDTFAVTCIQAGGDIYSISYILGITIAAAVERYGEWLVQDHDFLQRIG